MPRGGERAANAERTVTGQAGAHAARMGTRKLVIEIIVRVVDPDGTPADVDTSRGDGEVLPIYSLETPAAPGRSGRRTRRPTSVAPPSDAAALAPVLESLPGGADVVMGGRRWHRAAAGFGLMAIALAALGVTTWHAEGVTPASAAPVTAPVGARRRHRHRAGRRPGAALPRRGDVTDHRRRRMRGDGMVLPRPRPCRSRMSLTRWSEVDGRVVVLRPDGADVARANRCRRGRSAPGADRRTPTPGACRSSCQGAAGGPPGTTVRRLRDDLHARGAGPARTPPRRGHDRGTRPGSDGPLPPASVRTRCRPRVRPSRGGPRHSGPDRYGSCAPRRACPSCAPGGPPGCRGSGWMPVHAEATPVRPAARERRSRRSTRHSGR